MKKESYLTIGAILLLIIALWGVYWYQGKVKRQEGPVTSNQESVDQGSEENGDGEKEQDREREQDIVLVQEVNEELGVEFMRPKHAQVEEFDNGSIRVYFWGPTQVEGTELYDGYAVNISKVQLEEGQSLKAFAEADTKAILEVGEIVEPVTTTTINGRQAYRSVTQGLGIFTNLYLPGLTSQEAYHITYIAPDPMNLGFQAEVDAILESFTLITK